MAALGRHSPLHSRRQKGRPTDRPVLHSFFLPLFGSDNDDVVRQSDCPLRPAALPSTLYWTGSCKLISKHTCNLWFILIYPWFLYDFVSRSLGYVAFFEMPCSLFSDGYLSQDTMSSVEVFYFLSPTVHLRFFFLRRGHMTDRRYPRRAMGAWAKRVRRGLACKTPEVAAGPTTPHVWNCGWYRV